MTSALKQYSFHGHRGKLLKRIHDDIEKRIAYYETLFISSNAYGVRSFLRGSSRKDQMRARIAELERENRELEDKINRETARKAQIEAEAHSEELEASKKHEKAVKEAVENYDTLMQRYVAETRVNFEKKKKRGKK